MTPAVSTPRAPWREINTATEIHLDAPSVRPRLVVKAQQDPDYAGPKRENNFLVTATLQADSPTKLVELRFTSLDARFRLALVDFTGDGVEELLTVSRIVGWGTRDDNMPSLERREELLHVWLWNGPELKRILDLRVSGHSKVEAWSYDVAFEDLNADKVPDLQLIPEGVPRPDDPNDRFLIVPAGVVGYVYNQQHEKMEPWP